MTTSTTSLSVYQLRIVLRGISPLIWRRVLVRSDMTLTHLHVLLQILFAVSCCALCASIAGNGSGMCMTLAPTGNAISVSKRSSPWPHDASIPCVLGGNEQHHLKTAGRPGDTGSGCDQHRLYPPLEAMGVVAAAISTLLAADPQTSVREALGDLDEFREAVDCLDAYGQFQPDYFDRHTVNTQLQSLVWSAEETL